MSNDETIAKLKSEAVLNAGQEEILLAAMTRETLRALLQDCGYRVDIVDDGRGPFLRSATGSFAFDIRPGNAIAGAADRFADFVFVALLSVQGVLPRDLVNRWNVTRRFGRLFLDRSIPAQDFLVLSMDASLAGGVTVQHLRTQIDIWDNLLQQLVPWLRDELGRTAPQIDTAPRSAAEDPAAPMEMAARLDAEA